MDVKELPKIQQTLWFSVPFKESVAVVVLFTQRIKNKRDNRTKVDKDNGSDAAMSKRCVKSKMVRKKNGEKMLKYKIQIPE